LRNLAREKPDDNLKAEYDGTEAGFVALVEAVVCGTYTIFNYDPTEQEQKQLYARVKKVRISDLDDHPPSAADLKEMRARLIAAEAKLLNTARHCKGDASETGLVQFAHSICDLDETRGKYPTHIFKNAAGKETEALIPFNSDWKFNLFIRDMNPAVREPTSIEDNLTLFMKGAPERMIARCTRLLVNGEEVEMTDAIRKEVEDANSGFGNLGERVLAFARCRLDPAKFPKSSYQFDVKTWKTWGEKKERRFADYAD